MSYEQTIYINIPANTGRVIKAGTPIILFERFRLPYRTKPERESIREFSLYKRNTNVIEEALAVGRGLEVGVPKSVLKWIS